MRQLTTEQAEKLFTDPESGPEIYSTEINTLIQWAKDKRTNPEVTMYYGIVTSYVLGVKRGKAYEKRQQKKRFTLTPEETRQARAIAKAWDHDEDMSSIMDNWDAEDVVRVLLNMALTEETERQRSGSSSSVESEKEV